MQLGDVCVQITDGKHGDCQNQRGSGFYFLSCKDIGDGTISYDGVREITETDFLDTHKRTQLEPNDVLITNSGTIGRIALVPDNQLTLRTTFQKSVAILKPRQEVVVPRFLYYYLKHHMPRLVSFAGGTAQKNLLLRDMRAFEIELPPRRTQASIAAILSAYDDLIENGRRRQKILSELAHRTYRRCVSVGLQERGTSADPSLGDLITVEKGRKASLVSETEAVGYVPVLLLDTIEGRKLAYASTDGAVLADPNDVVMVADGARSGVAFNGLRGAVGSTLARLRPIDAAVLSPFELMLFLVEHESDLRSRNVGSAIPHMNKEYLLRLRVSMATGRAREQLLGLAESIFSLLWNLRDQSRVAAEVRDLLLPRLMSGEVDVNKLNIDFPDAA